MADPVDRWKGRTIRRWLFAIGSTASLAMCAKQQYGREQFLGDIPYVFAFAAAFVLLTCITTLVAGIRRSWGEGLRSYVESTVFLLATVAAMFGLRWTFKGLGLGHWPPRNGIDVDAFREHRATLTTECERLLAEARARVTDPSKPAASASDPHADRPTFERSAPLEALGVEQIWVALDGRSLRLVFWEGEYSYNPVFEKGLLFVEPRTASDREKKVIDRTAVEDLGDGWSVYED